MTQGVTIDFNANLARFTSAMDKATNDLSKWQTHAERTSKNISNALNSVGVGLSVAGVAAWGKSLIDAADNVNDLSQRIGISVKDLGGWQLAAEQSGASLETIGKGIKGLAPNIREFSKEFEKLGVSTKDPSQAMIDLADIVSGMPDGFEKTELAVKLFGKAGMDLIPLLNMGSKGLAESREKAKEYAEELEKLAPKADAFNDSLKVLELRVKAKSFAALQAEIDGMIGFVDFLTDATSGTEGFARAMGFVTDMVPKWTGPLYLLAQAFNTVAQASNSDFVARAAALAGVGGNPAGRVSVGKIGGAAPAAAPDTRGSNLLKTLGGTGGKSGRASGESKASKAHDFDKEINAEYKRAQAATQRAADAAARTAEQEADAMQRLREKYLNVIDPLKKYQDELIEIEQLRLKGTLSADEAADAVKQVSAAMEKAKGGLDEIADTGDDAFKKLTSAVEGWGRQFTDTLADMAMGGKATFTDLADSIIRDLIRIQIQKNITDPLVKAGTSILDGAFKGGGSGLMASLTDFFIPKFSFASGTDYVPRDMIAQIHQGERIVPANQNRPGSADAGITINQTLNAPGADAGTLQQIRALMAAQREEFKRMVPALVSRQQLRNRITPMGM